MFRKFNTIDSRVLSSPKQFFNFLSENDKPYVFKSYDGILKKQKIEIQSQNDEFTVVKDGLDKQDIIIRYPSDKMNEGDAIPVDTLGIDTEGMQSE